MNVSVSENLYDRSISYLTLLLRNVCEFFFERYRPIETKRQGKNHILFASFVYLFRSSSEVMFWLK